MENHGPILVLSLLNIEREALGERMTDLDQVPSADRPRRFMWRFVTKVLSVISDYWRPVATFALIIVGMIALSIAWKVVPALLASHPRVTIGKDTTYVLGPLREDGYVDYVAAINENASIGVTRENNAAIPLVEVIGMLDSEGEEEIEALLFEALQTQPLPEEQRFKDVAMFVREADLPVQDETVFAAYDIARHRPWNQSEFPHLYRWIKANDNTLDRIVEATRRPRFYVPLLVEKDNDDPGVMMGLIPFVQSTRKVAYALLTRAMLRAQNGDAAGACQDILACHRLGRLIGQSPTVVQWLVGIVIDGMAVYADCALAHSGKISPERLAIHRKQLEELPSRLPLAEKFRDERLGALDFMCGMARGRVEEDVAKMPWYFHPNYDEALRQINLAADAYEDALRIPDRRQRCATLRSTNKSYGRGIREINQSWFLNSEEKHTQICAQLAMIWSFGSPAAVARADDQIQMTLAMADTAMALALYRADHNAYPESLDSLIPKYRATIPQDWRSDGTIQYRREDDGYAMWSIGENEIDDHGDRELDYVIRMPVRDEDYRE